ncbi:DISARM system phospholipase D-like protein DrmC [Streptomyces sp. NPDC050264]|uniref:DISARM system phospholipase D-like protein DrmC n=1 Tax=Streptomyces sp. NPDC050264 TaxID=3155038 RepID=UPI00343668C8
MSENFPGQRSSSDSLPVPREWLGSPRLPHLLAALHDRLPREQAIAWEGVLEQAIGPEDPELSRFAFAQPAAGLAEQLGTAIRAWAAECPDLPGAALSLAMKAIGETAHPPLAQPVVSGPVSPSVPARLTSGIALEVIRSASSSLLISSFAARDAEAIIAEITDAARRGVQVDLLLEETTSAARAFVALPSDVRVWHRLSGSGVLHAKLIAADRDTAVLGSANLTDRASTDNIELGIILRDPAVVGPLVDHFRWLISPQAHIMRRSNA